MPDLVPVDHDPFAGTSSQDAAEVAAMRTRQSSGPRNPEVTHPDPQGRAENIAKFGMGVAALSPIAGLAARATALPAAALTLGEQGVSEAGGPEAPGAPKPWWDRAVKPALPEEPKSVLLTPEEEKLYPVPEQPGEAPKPPAPPAPPKIPTDADPKVRSAIQRQWNLQNKAYETQSKNFSQEGVAYQQKSDAYKEAVKARQAYLHDKLGQLHQSWQNEVTGLQADYDRQVQADQKYKAENESFTQRSPYREGIQALEIGSALTGGRMAYTAAARRAKDLQAATPELKSITSKMSQPDIATSTKDLVRRRRPISGTELGITAATAAVPYGVGTVIPSFLDSVLLPKDSPDRIEAEERLGGDWKKTLEPMKRAAFETLTTAIPGYAAGLHKGHFGSARDKASASIDKLKVVGEAKQAATDKGKATKAEKAKNPPALSAVTSSASTLEEATTPKKPKKKKTT